MGQAWNHFNFCWSECACWKTKTIQNHLNFTDFDNAAAYCVPRRQRHLKKKKKGSWQQAIGLADVDQCSSAASAERATVHGGAEQNGLSTATDIYCAPWKKCRTEQNLNRAWVCGNVCQHSSFSLLVIWDFITVGIYSWLLKIFMCTKTFCCPYFTKLCLSHTC